MSSYRGFSFPGDMPLFLFVLVSLACHSASLKLSPVKKFLQPEFSDCPAPPRGRNISGAEAIRLNKIHRASTFLIKRIWRIKRPCLLRTLVLHEWCRRRGIAGRMVIGVRKQKGALRTHIWLEIMSVPFRESPRHIKLFSPVTQQKMLRYKDRLPVYEYIEFASCNLNCTFKKTGRRISSGRLNEKHYRAEEVPIRLLCDSRAWMDSLELRLALPPADGQNNGRGLNLALYEASPSMLERILPLPGNGYVKSRETLPRCREAACRVFACGEKVWNDFPGLGRCMVDMINGRAQGVLLGGRAAAYACAGTLLCFNPLTALMSIYGYMPVHALFVEIYGKGFLFSGISGNGCSSAAFALARRGHHFVSGGSMLLREKEGEFTALSIFRLIRPDRPAEQEYFPGRASGNCARPEEQDRYRWKRPNGAPPRCKSAPISCVLAFKRTDDHESRLGEADPGLLFDGLFTGAIGEFETADAEKKSVFLKALVQKTVCHQVLSGKDPEHSARLIERLAGSLEAGEKYD